MTQKLLSIIALLCLTFTSARADSSGSCGTNVTYSYNESTQTLTISGTGAMEDYESSSEKPWDSYLSSIKSIVIENGVTSIGNNAFQGCYRLTSIDIPASVTSIGDDAFQGCSVLGSIIVAAENANYSSDENGVLFNKDKTALIRYPQGKAVAPYTIPASVTTIGKSAFLDSKLTSVDIPAIVTSIGASAFKYCSGLASISIPASVKSIGDNAFYGCSGLTSITFASGSQLTTIGESAFMSCVILTSVDIPASVTSIGNNAFSGCKGLTSITIPTNVTSIGDDAFEDCLVLGSVKVYAPSCTLGSDAFAGATGIKKIYVPNVDAYKAADNWSNYSNLITGFLGVTLKPEYISVPSIYAGTQNYFKLELTNNDSEAAQNVVATLYLDGELIDTKTIDNGIAPGEDNAKTIELVDATIRQITETTVIGDNNENAVYTVVVKEGDVEIARQEFSFVILYNGNLGKDYAYDSYHPTLRDFTFIGDVQVLTQEGSTYMDSSTESRTETFTVSLGEGESVKQALLYAPYNWEKVNVGTVSSCATTFNGASITSIASYRDQSNLGSYGKYGYGMLVYDVTDDVVNGENKFVLSKPKSVVAFYPSSLIVMVNKPSGKLKAVYILEEADYLSTNYSKNRVHSYKSSFDNLDKVADGDATLYVFAAGAQAGEGDLKINGEEYANVWSGTYKTFGTYQKDVTIGSDGVSVEFISTGTTILALHQMLVVDLSNRILIETGKPYIVKTLADNSAVPVNCQTFLPVGYDLSKATVTLKPVKGAPKGLPVIIGSTTDGQVIPADAYLQVAADPGDTSGKITSDDIATDYKSVNMSPRFVITDGTKNLSKILADIDDVSASDAVFFVLTNGRFTRVDVSADDLAENANPAKSGLLLFVLTKWEYMNMGSGSGTNSGAGARSIGIGGGETTAIDNLKFTIDNEAGAWYDLQGRRLNGKPTKGIYIHKGRKIVMK